MSRAEITIGAGNLPQELIRRHAMHLEGLTRMQLPVTLDTNPAIAIRIRTMQGSRDEQPLAMTLLHSSTHTIPLAPTGIVTLRTPLVGRREGTHVERFLFFERSEQSESVHPTIVRDVRRVKAVEQFPYPADSTKVEEFLKKMGEWDLQQFAAALLTLESREWEKPEINEGRVFTIPFSPHHAESPHEADLIELERDMERITGRVFRD